MSDKKTSYNVKQSSNEDENLLTMAGATDNVPFNHTPGAGRRKLCNQQSKAQRNLVFSYRLLINALTKQ